MRKVFFRADAGVEIGYGHFIRTLALADMLKEDFDCAFFTQTPTEFQRREVSKVCKLIEMPSSDKKYNDFIEYLKGDEIVVLDNYFFTTDYQKKIKAKGCKLVCIDDMHDKHYVADIVINHGLDNPAVFDVESYTRLCLGFKWALLRKEFLDAAESFIREDSKDINSVLITFGGCDEKDNTSMAIKLVLEKRPDITISAIIGDGYKGEIVNSPNVRYFKNLDAGSMSKIMMDSDLTICSASTVGIEALACKSKIVVKRYVDNQEDLFNTFIKSGSAINIKELDRVLLESHKSYSWKKVPLKGIRKRYISVFKSLSRID